MNPILNGTKETIPKYRRVTGTEDRKGTTPLLLESDDDKDNNLSNITPDVPDYELEIPDSSPIPYASVSAPPESQPTDGFTQQQEGVAR